MEIPRASSLKILDSKLSLRSSFVTCSTNTGASLLERSATLPDVHLPSLDMKAFTSPHSTASNKHQGYVTKATNALVVENSRNPRNRLKVTMPSLLGLRDLGTLWLHRQAYVTIWVKETPASIGKEPLRIIINGLHDFGPVQVLQPLGVFDVT